MSLGTAFQSEGTVTDKAIIKSMPGVFKKGKESALGTSRVKNCRKIIQEKQK